MDLTGIKTEQVPEGNRKSVFKPVYRAGIKLAGNIIDQTSKLELPAYKYPVIPREKYLGFEGVNDASLAVDKAVTMANGVGNLIIASDIDQTLSFIFDGYEDHALQRLLQVREAGAQVFLQTNRNKWFPGTGKIIDHLLALGFSEDEIYLGMDQQTGVFRDKASYARYLDRTEGIVRQNPAANMIHMFDSAIALPIATPQDLWGGPVLGLVRPLIGDLIKRDSPIPNFGFIGVNKFI